MSSHFAKPENALRKGKDLLKVGKPSSALKTLHNILVARRYRLWSPTHEKIMVSAHAQTLRRQLARDAFAPSAGCASVMSIWETDISMVNESAAIHSMDTPEHAAIPADSRRHSRIGGNAPLTQLVCCLRGPF